MDLELGLKITKTRDDNASISEYRFAKAGPVFQSRETNTMFILTANIKGYKKKNININISEDGSRISISGEKPVQNILMMGWLMHRKEVDVSGFNKVFKIPDGVNLDGIKAKYDEEEWTLNIFMPKLVKGICGVKIEEVKEEERDRGKSEVEKRKGDHILSSVGETSQKRSKDSEVQAMEKEGELFDKILDDANREIIKEELKKVEESKLGTDGGKEKSFGEKVGLEGNEVMKISELEQNVGGGTSQKIGDTSQKETEESKLRIEDGGVKGMREEVGKIECEAVKTTEMKKNVGEDMSQNIGDTSQDKEFEVQEVEDNVGFVEEEKMVTKKTIDDANGNIIGELIQKEIEVSKAGIEDREGESVREEIGKAGYKRMKTSEMEQNVGAHVTQDIGDTSQGVSEESVIEQMGEDKSTVEKMDKEESQEMLAEANVSIKEEILGESSKQKQFGEHKPETKDRLKESVKESSMEPMETMKAPKLDQTLDDHIPINRSKEEFMKSRIQQKEKTESIEENMDGGQSEKMPVEASQDTQKHVFGDSIRKDFKMSKIETEDGDQEYVGEKDDKEEFTLREEFPQQLQKATTVDESKGLSTSKIQETEDVKEAMTKRKPREIEYFVDKGEGEEPSRMHMEENKDSTQARMKESDVKEAMIKREGQDNEYFVDKCESEERKRMHMKAKKDLTKETMQESKDVKEAMVKRKGEEIGDEGEEPKRMHIEVRKDLTTETMQETEDVTKVMFKRKDKETESYVDKGEGEEPRRKNAEAKKDIEKETTKENEYVREAIVKSKAKEFQHFVEKGEGEELTSKQMKVKKDLTKETMQESGDVKEGLVKREGKEIKCFVDKGEGEEPKMMHMEEKKDLAKETMHGSDDVKEAMVKREGKEIEYFGIKSTSEKHKRVHSDANDSTKEIMQETKDVKETVVKREGKEIKCFVDKGEGEEPKMMHMEEKKDLAKDTMHGSNDVKEAMVKREGKEIEYFGINNKGEKQKRVHSDAKDLTKETMQETKDVKETVVQREGEKREGQELKRILVEEKNDSRAERTKETEGVKVMVKRKDREEKFFAENDEGEEPRRMLMEGSEDVKEAMAKRKGKGTKYISDKSEREDPKRVHKLAKKDLTIKTMQESEDAKEAKVKRKSKEIDHFLDGGEGEEPNLMHVKAKKNMKKETMQESENVIEEKVKRKDDEIENYEDKGDGGEPRGMLMKTKKELIKETMKESEDVKEEMVQRKGKEIDHFVDKDEDEEPTKMHMEAKKDLQKNTMQKSEDVKEAMVRRKGKEIEYFGDKREGKEPIKMHTNAKNDFKEEIVQENEGVKEAMFKRKGKEIGYFVGEGEDEELKTMHIEAKKDSTTKTIQETEDVKEVMVKRKKKEIDNFADKAEGKELKGMRVEAKDLTKETMQESEDVKETMVKRKGKETDHFVDKSQGEELKGTHLKAKKDITKDAMQDEMEKTKNGIKDSDQQNVLEKTVRRKIEVPTEELPRLAAKEDGNKGLEVTEMEEGKETTKEEMAETETLREKVKGKKSKKTEEAGRVTEKNTTTEILQKETEQSYNMVKVIFEVLGTFQAKLPMQMMEAISKNKKDKDEYVIVKLKGEGSIKMHVQPNEVFDEDETEDRIEKDHRKPKLKSTDQMVDSLAKTRDEPNVKEIEEVVKRKSEEAEVVESSTEEKVQEPESGRISLSLKEVPEDKTPKVFDIGSAEREMQSTKDSTTPGKEINEVEQERAKDKTQNTKLLPPTIQSEETRESKFEGKKQDPIKPKKVEGEQSTYNIEKASRFKQVAEKMHASREREQKKESEVTPKGVEKAKEEMSLMPKAIQSKELDELSLPRKDYKSPKIDEVQQKKEGQRTIQALEATTSKEEELAQATATHSKVKSEIHEPSEVQFPSPSTEMWSKEAHELDKHGMKQGDSKAESLVQMQEGQESIHPIEGTAESKVVADEVDKLSKISSSSSTQPFEFEGEDKTDDSRDEESKDSDKDSEIDGQESTKGETYEEVEQKETLQPAAPADQQCINKEKEEGHEMHEIEEEKACEHGDEFSQEDSQLLEEQRECEEGATAEKNIQKKSKKLFVSLMIAGSALLASGIFFFIRHKRARNRPK